MSDSFYYASPVGWLHLEKQGDTLKKLSFAGQQGEFKQTEDKGFKDIIKELDLYFAGKNKQFKIKLDPEGTEFQKETWREMLNIPWGQTVSYSELAARIGRPKAVRAVANANANNPIAIIVPCHRVIGKNGRLTGFGGGIDVKRKLLRIEKSAACEAKA